MSERETKPCPVCSETGHEVVVAFGLRFLMCPAMPDGEIRFSVPTAGWALVNVAPAAERAVCPDPEPLDWRQQMSPTPTDPEEP